MKLRRTYIPAIVLALVFVLSMSVTVWDSSAQYAQFLFSGITAIGTISAVILGWRADRRAAKEQALKIAQLEKELEELKSQGKQTATNTQAP